MNMDSFYLFEVLEGVNSPLGKFRKGERFIGFQMEVGTALHVCKSNTESSEWIPLDKVKKLYKIKFEEI